MHNYKEIIEDINKYHFLFVTKKKVCLLASSNELKEAKDKTLEKIKSKLDSFEDKVIIRFKFFKIKNSTYEDSKTAKLTSIGGPILIYLDFYQVNSKGKLVRNEKESRNDTIYITENFLDNNKLKNSHLKLIANNAFYSRLSKTILSINTIDKLLN